MSCICEEFWCSECPEFDKCQDSKKKIYIGDKLDRA